MNVPFLARTVVVIKDVRHIGIVVKNLKQSLFFYKNFLGLRVLEQKIEEGPYIDNVVGFKNTKVEWIKLITIDNFIIELLQYHSHPDIADNSSIIPSNRIGCSHVAFTVKNIDEVYKQLKEEKIHCNAPPCLSPSGQVKVMYCHDPDGAILELVEEVQLP